MSDNMLIFAALAAGGLYLYSQQKPTVAVVTQLEPQPETLTQTLTNQIQPDALPAINASLVCPDETLLLGDGTCCPRDYITERGTCASCPIGSDSALDPSGQSICCASDSILNGLCMPCPNGYILSADGSTCESTEQTTNSVADTMNNLNFTTGNQIGDVAVNIGIGVASGVVFDVVQDAAINKLASKLSTEVAERAAAKIAAKVATKAAAKAAEKVGVSLATKLAVKAASSAVQWGAEASTVVGLPLMIIDMIYTVVSITLVQTLSLDKDSFEPNGPGDFGFSDLPTWASTVLGAIPIMGSIIDVLSPVVKIHTGCPAGWEGDGVTESLCYEPAKKHDDPNKSWKCESFLCYEQFPSFEGQSAGTTLTSVTKKIVTDTGTVPDTCASNQDKSGLLCYNRESGYDMVGGVAWQQCPGGFTDTGIRCERTYGSIGRIPDIGPCNAGDTDDKTSCWAPLSTTGGACSGGLCHTSWNDCCSRGLFDECYGCLSTYCDPISCDPIVTTGGVITKTLMDRQTCKSDESMIDKLCYSNCDSGYTREGLICSGSFNKSSHVVAPHSASCGPDKVDGAPWGSAGLCYGAVPTGFQRQVAGLLSQTCASGWGDGGVFCNRPTYTRTPKVGINFSIRERKKEQVERDPVTCSQMNLTDAADLAACNDLLCLPDESIAEGTTQDFCVSRCRDSYTPAANGLCVRAAGGTDPITGNAFTADSYQRRNVWAINWDDIPTTTESTWAAFAEAKAVDVASYTLVAGSVPSLSSLVPPPPPTPPTPPPPPPSLYSFSPPPFQPPQPTWSQSNNSLYTSFNPNGGGFPS